MTLVKRSKDRWGPVSEQVIELFAAGTKVVVLCGSDRQSCSEAVRSCGSTASYRFEGGMVRLNAAGLDPEELRAGRQGLPMLDAFESESGALVVIEQIESATSGTLDAIISLAEHAMSGSRVLIGVTGHAPGSVKGQRVGFVSLDEIPRAAVTLRRFPFGQSRTWANGSETVVEELRRLFGDQLVESEDTVRAPSLAALHDERGIPVEQDSPLVSAAIAVSSRISQELMAELTRRPELLHTLHWRRFEELVADLFARDGFEVELTARSGDKGADVFAVRRDDNRSMLYVVECKRWSVHRQVTANVVRELHGVVERERATRGIVATTSFFAPAAIAARRDLEFRLELRDYYALAQWLQSPAELW